MAGFTYAPTGHTSSSDGGNHGVFGFVGNLVHDIGDAAKGTPEGLVQLAEHPIRTTENMGKATWQTWSPLFHGHVGEFGHNFYAHPLAPMLDIATVFTGGASLAAATGVKAADLGLIPEDAALARLGKMPKELTLSDPKAAEKLAAGKAIGKDYVKHLPSNPIYNKGYRMALASADKHPGIPNWFGSSKVYGRLQRSDWANSGLAYNAQFAALMKAGKILSEGGHYLGDVEEQLHANAYRDLWQNSPEINAHEILSKYGGRLPEGFRPIRPDLMAGKSRFKLFKKSAQNVDELSGHFQKLGEKMTLAPDKWRNAVYKGADGQPMIRLAHTGAMRRSFEDGAKSSHFLAKLWHYPTAIWKYSMVGASPRTVVDNGVGNWVMYAMRQGGAHALHGFIQAVHYTRGERKAMQMLKETGKLPEGYGSHFLNRYFKHELGNTFGTAVLGDEAGNVLSKMYKHSVYPLVHKYADVPVRASAISAYLRGDAAVKALMDKGMSFEDAASAALKTDRGLRERAVIHARNVAGNYTSLSKTEQRIRNIVPFYLWDKHIVMHTANMLRDRPGAVAAGTALGQEGATQERNILGDIPQFMLGQLPVHVPFFSPDKGRTSLLDTTGLNPYSTIPDIAGLAQALSTGHTEDKPGDTILSTVNPLIKGLVEQTMGASATGRPATSHGGVVPSALTDLFNSMRPIQAVRAAAGASPPSSSKSGTPRLYKSDINTILSTLAGFPIREADLQHAQDLQKQIENHGKKPKKGSGFTYR